MDVHMNKDAIDARTIEDGAGAHVWARVTMMRTRRSQGEATFAAGLALTRARTHMSARALNRIDKITATLTALTSTPLNVQAQVRRRPLGWPRVERRLPAGWRDARPRKAGAPRS